MNAALTGVESAEHVRRGRDTRAIWATTKAKKHKFFDTCEEKAFLDQPQPLRTDLEFVAEGRDFIDVQIPPR